MNPKLSALTAARRGWFTRADAVEAGYSDSELRRRLRAGQWSRLTRDVYVEPAGWPTASRRGTERPAAPAENRARMRRTHGRIGVVVSHQSAITGGEGSDLGRIADGLHVSRVACAAAIRSHPHVHRHGPAGIRDRSVRLTAGWSVRLPGGDRRVRRHAEVRRHRLASYWRRNGARTGCASAVTRCCGPVGPTSISRTRPRTASAEQPQSHQPTRSPADPRGCITCRWP